MTGVESKIADWLNKQIDEERNPRRRELLQKGLGHGTTEFLKNIWYPAVGNLNHLYPEWEVRDYSNRFRYLDLAYMPSRTRGCIEIQDFKSHARDIEAWRFKDLCKKQAYLALDDWLFLPIAYLSITDEPEVCKHIVLTFLGKFVSTPLDPAHAWIEAKTLRYARGIARPFTSHELASHINRSDRQTRRILKTLVDSSLLVVADDKQRYRTYQLVSDSSR
jgi:hypothetical protein